MKKTFEFGKIDLHGKGRKNNLVTVDIRTDEKDGEMTFAASAYVWNNLKTDCLWGGQCLDGLEPYLKDNKLFMEILRLWKLYHLNDMHPECKHQRELGWNEIAVTEVTIDGGWRNETKTLSWVKPSEHPDGLLCKPCPVCGYKYGTSWLLMPIPEVDKKAIKKLFEEE